MWSFLLEFLRQFLWAFSASAPYFLIGLLAAGVLRVFVPDELLVRWLGGSRRRGVLTASMLGVPIPICSCGIVPLSIGLRRKGAGRGATMAFLIATPETGVPSIALTWGLMGPLLAVIRPLVSWITAVLAGLFIEAADEEAGSLDGEEHLPAGDDEGDGEAAECGSCGCAADGEDCEGEDTQAASPPPRGRTAEALHYGFIELLTELAPWLLVGLLLTALIGASIPDDLLQGKLVGTGLPAMLLAIAVGLPLYMCASGSTPMAAALVAKGVSPGAALVFLLTGPATNVATITLVRRTYGDRFLRIYLGTIAGVAILAGLGFNTLLAATGWTVLARVGSGELGGVGPIELLSALVLAALIGANLWRSGLRAPLAELREGSLALGVLFRPGPDGARPWRRVAAVAAGIAALLWLGTAVTQVRPGERGVVRHFGAPAEGLLEPGLHLHWPRPIDRVDICAVDQARLLELGFRVRGGYSVREPEVADELDLITGDENLVDLTAVVEYRAVDPRTFLFDAEDPEAIIRHAIVASVSDTLVDREIDAVLTTDRAAVQERALARAQELLDGYGLGVELAALRLMNVHAPPQVHDAFREVASAQEDAATTIRTAQGERDRALAGARGAAAEARLTARADAEHARARAAGEALAFSALARAARAAPAGTEKRLYLETLERILPGRHKVVRPGSGAGAFELWLTPAATPEPERGPGTISVPVIPQAPGDPTTAEVDLSAGYP